MVRGTVNSILATDVGSTTTKAILIEKRGDEFRLVTRGEMPTTVEAPWEDVMIGVRKAIRRVEELTGRPILAEDGTLIRPKDGDAGVDVYVSTSSAGGGLQMMVVGLVKKISAASAHRAALGAGAAVLDVIAVDDGRSQSEQISRITELRPDMVLVSGGVDGGSVSYVAAIAETIARANPKPRFGATYKLPLIYAGNPDASDIVKDICGEVMSVQVVENLRPSHDVENLGPAREVIHDLFMNHVMAQAPGYGELLSMVDTTVMPTPGAVGSIIAKSAEKLDANIIGADIGGATTDVFSFFDATFTRTVSANLGMSYSICNVMDETGFSNVRRFIPFEMDEARAADLVANKMIRPTTLPMTLEHLLLEQACAREALRLSFEHHKSLARKVEKEELRVFSGAQVATKKSYGQEIIDMKKCDLLVGSGGALSHAPRRAQAVLMLLDSFQPEGITDLAVDSIFMMPHLGVISSLYPEIAAEVFDKDCLLRLGTAISPVGQAKPGAVMARVNIHTSDGRRIQEKIVKGEISVVPLGEGETAEVRVVPHLGTDVGSGKGRPRSVRVSGGLSGIILDGRGRPIEIPQEPWERVQCLGRWFEAMDAYPMEEIVRLQGLYPAPPPKPVKKRGGLFGFFK